MAAAMKQIEAFGVALCVMLTLCGCGQVTKSQDAPYTLTIVNNANENTQAVRTSTEVRMPEASGTAVYESYGVTMDASNTREGYIMLKSAANEKRLKLQIMLDQTYTYDLYPETGYETFPLQMGDGHYTVRVLEQVSGSSYTPIAVWELDVALSAVTVTFTYPNQYVDYGRDDAAVALALSLCAGETDAERIVQTCYDYVVKHIRYDYEKAATVESGYLPVPDETLDTGKGICFDYAALLAAMLRAFDIPTRLVIGRLAPNEYYHAWTSVYLNGAWVWMDATIDPDADAESNYYAERQY